LKKRHTGKGEGERMGGEGRGTVREKNANGLSTFPKSGSEEGRKVLKKPTPEKRVSTLALGQDGPQKGGTLKRGQIDWTQGCESSKHF